VCPIQSKVASHGALTRDSKTSGGDEAAAVAVPDLAARPSAASPGILLLRDPRYEHLPLPIVSTATAVLTPPASDMIVNIN